MKQQATSWRLAICSAISLALFACSDSPSGPEPVASVTLSAPSQAVVGGGTLQVSASVKDAGATVLTGRSVTWSSGDQSVATVNGTGLVTGIAPGSARITAMAEGITGHIDITVALAPVESVTISPALDTLTVGETAQLQAATKDSRGSSLSGRTVTWTSSSDAVATVSPSGLVTAVGIGKATITSTSEGKPGTAEIVVIPVPVASVEISPLSRSIPVGGTLQMTATSKDAGGNVLVGRTVSWTTSSAAIATVSTTGVVTAVAPGEVDITAEVEGKTAKSDITVEQTPVASLEVSPDGATLEVGQTQQLTAIAKDAAGNPLTGRSVTWSSNSTAATVSSSGLVTAAVLGDATITATVGGVSKAVTITVAQPAPATGIRIRVTSPVETTRFFLGVDGGPYADPQVIQVTTAPTKNALLSVSVPAGGPYRVRVVVPEAQTGDPHSTVAVTGQATGISVASGAASAVDISLARPSYSVSAPATAGGGSTVTVSWTVTDPGSTVENVGFPWQGAVEYSGGSGGGSSSAVAGVKTSPTTYTFTATFQAPLTPGVITIRTRTLSFVNVYTGFVGMVSHWAPSSARGETLHSITIQ